MRKFFTTTARIVMCFDSRIMGAILLLKIVPDEHSAAASPPRGRLLWATALRR